MSKSIRLYCFSCDICDCPYSSYAYEGSETGCLRELSEDMYTHYYHFMEERWPFRSFWSFRTLNSQTNEFIEFMNEEVAYTPLLHKYNEYGKPEISDHSRRQLPPSHQ